jgi:membrane-bound serine protease (ClpP class)
MLGIYGIFFGLNMPGTFVPEIIGAIALILALFGLGNFDVNVLGIMLIVIAVILFVTEAFTPTFGIFTALGAAALIAGALLLPVEPMLPEDWYNRFIVTVLGMAAVTVGFFSLVIWKVIAVSRKPGVHEHFGMRGYEGTVTEDLDPQGMIKIRGERWNARSADGNTISRSTSVTVTGQNGMLLLVERSDEEVSQESQETRK